MSHRLTFGVLVVLMSGCATLAKIERPHLAVSSEPATFTAVAFDQVNVLTAYQLGGQKQRVEWLVCQRHDHQASGMVLAMHPDRAGFAKATFCRGWIAQSFLTAGFDVLAVNRPGYGASTGRPDFTGAPSLIATKAAVTAALATKNVKPLRGAWGYSTGATAAALVSRRLGALKFLILGDGVYDFDQTLAGTQDAYLKKDLETIKRTGGEKAMEDRSIAYDVSGLPHTIVVYHARLDKAVPFAQAQAFADALRSSGDYKVTFKSVDGAGHEIPLATHRHVIDVLARPLAHPAKP